MTMSKTKRNESTPSRPSGNLADELRRAEKSRSSRFWTYAPVPEQPTASTDDLGRKWGCNDDINIGEGCQTRYHRTQLGRQLEELHCHFNRVDETPSRLHIPGEFPMGQCSRREPEPEEERSSRLTESDLSSLQSERMDGSGDLEERDGRLSRELALGLNTLSKDCLSGELADGDRCLSGELALCLQHNIMSRSSGQLAVWEKSAGSVEGERDSLSQCNVPIPATLGRRLRASCDTIPTFRHQLHQSDSVRWSRSESSRGRAQPHSALVRTTRSPRVPHFIYL